MRPCSDPPTATGPAPDVPIVYADQDVARLLAEVKRRSGRRRRHQRRIAQSAACMVVALVAWLSWAPAAGGEVQYGHQAVAVAALDGGRPTPSRA